VNKVVDITLKRAKGIAAGNGSAGPVAALAPAYAELMVTSNFSFLRSG